MEFEVPKRHILRPPLTWSNMFCAGRDKRGALVRKAKGPWQRKYGNNKILMIVFAGGRDDEDKRRQKNAQT